MKGNLKRKKIFDWIWLALLGATGFGLGWMANTWVNTDVQMIQKTKNLILSESFFSHQSKTELTYAAIRGMLSVIDDPFAEFIEPEAAQDMLNAFKGDTGVVGLYSENQSGQVVVLMVFPGGAAEEAGIKVGDIILAIDGKTLDADVDSSEAGLLMRGLPGTLVELKILRDGQELGFALMRKEQEFVKVQMLPEGIGYVSLIAFNENASKKMKSALEKLLEDDPIGLIWDLRNNEGGDMQAAQEILSFFIEDGLLFSAELTRDRKVEFIAKGGAFAGEVPLVVLMDETTYSAGETAAAAVAEMGRGTTVGSTSYGKGLIQATIPLVDETLLQMTIARWLSSNGEWYNQRGVPAQIEVLDDPATETDELLQKAIDILLAAP